MEFNLTFFVIKLRILNLVLACEMCQFLNYGFNEAPAIIFYIAFIEATSRECHHLAWYNTLLVTQTPRLIPQACLSCLRRLETLISCNCMFTLVKPNLELPQAKLSLSLVQLCPSLFAFKVVFKINYQISSTFVHNGFVL